MKSNSSLHPVPMESEGVESEGVESGGVELGRVINNFYDSMQSF